MFNSKMADCLFDASANSASHLTLSPSARGGPRFSGDRATCLALLTLGAESSRIMQAKVQARSRNQEVVRAMVANGHGYTIANVRPKSLTALDGRKLKAIRLTGRHKPVKIGIMTLNHSRKPLILTTFEAACRRLINTQKIPGMFAELDT